MSRWRKSCPFIGPEHSNQGMKEEDKGSSKFLNFACGTESVQPGRLDRKHASLACFLPASQICPSFTIGKYPTRTPLECCQPHGLLTQRLHTCLKEKMQVCTAALICAAHKRVWLCANNLVGKGLDGNFSETRLVLV